MLSYFSRSPTSSSPEYKKGRYQVLEENNEDNSLEDQAVKETFQDAPPWISALYNEMKSVRKEMAQVKIIRDELTQVRSILNDFLNFKKETFAKLDDFKKSVDFCSKQYDEFAKCNEGLVRKIDSLREENSELKSKLAMCENAVDDLEQYGRRNCLLFHGIKETTGEDCDEEIINLCRERLHIEITPTMIEQSHRIGSKKRSMNSEAKTRPIIAKFVSYRDRQVVFNSKKLLKESGFVITESLTKKRMSLLNEGRKTVGSKNIWTLDGRIHVKLDDKLYIINKLSDLDRFKT